MLFLLILKDEVSRKEILMKNILHVITFDGDDSSPFYNAPHAGMVLGWRWPWISVKDRLPKDDEVVLVYLDEKDTYYDTRCTTAKYDGIRWVTDHFCESSYIENVTHWMPLPLPPKE
jgi:Protein of unknown function (DUF551)